MFHVKHNEHTYNITFLHKISKNEFLKNIIKINTCILSNLTKINKTIDKLIALF